MSIMDKGEALFYGGFDSDNTLSCGQCHPNACSESYPMFQQEPGKVATLWQR